MRGIRRFVTKERALMDKKQVAATLEEIAALLELKGENPFKTRSYTNGARAVQQLNEDLGTVVAEGRIEDLKGVGKALAEKISTLVTTGELPYLDQLRAEFPQTIFELFRIPGLGPKRIRIIYDELGIDSLEKLQMACEAGYLTALKGFSTKLEKKILNGIEFARRHADQFLIDQATATANELIGHLETDEHVIRLKRAGSLRRCKELVKDVDIIAASPQPESLMDLFLAAPGVEKITGRGSTKSSIVLESGMAVDLRVVTEEQFPYALAHFTGSKDHNVVMRQRAKDRGLKLNEYGLFGEDGALIPCKDEAALFAALDLPPIPPELREDRGEFEAKRLPDLVKRANVKGFIHCHTTYSDGVDSLADMATAAQAAGHEYLIVTDHSQSAAYAHGLRPDRVRQQHEEIDRLNATYEGFRILKGIESDILTNGDLDYDDEVLGSFEFIIASVHTRLDMPEDEATARILRAIENPHTHMLGHLTGRLLLSRKGYPLDMERILRACAAHGVAIEINANPQRLDIDWRHIKRGKERGVKFAIAPDAHRIEGLRFVGYGLGIARKGWLEAGDLLNNMTVEELLAWRR